jgi:hypothetical protein
MVNGKAFPCFFSFKPFTDPVLEARAEEQCPLINMKQEHTGLVS